MAVPNTLKQKKVDEECNKEFRINPEDDPRTQKRKIVPIKDKYNFMRRKMIVKLLNHEEEERIINITTDPKTLKLHYTKVALQNPRDSRRQE